MTDFKHDEVRTSRRVTRYYLEGVMVAKECNGCSRTLPPSEFHKRTLNKTDGLSAPCKECVSKLGAEWYRADPGRSYKQNAWNRRNKDKASGLTLAHMKRLTQRSEEEFKADLERMCPDGVKACRKCKAVKPVSEFHKDRSQRSTLKLECKMCTKAIGVIRRTKENIGYWTSIGIDPTFCFYCEFPIYEGDQLHSDHVIAEHIGGPDVMNNQVPTCRSCNMCKNDKYFLAFLNEDFPYREDQERILSKLRSHGIDWTLPRRESKRL